MNQRIELVDDVAWDDEADWREAEVVTLDDDGEEVSRSPTLVYYNPAERVHDRGHDAAMAELAQRRADALGQPVVVIGFPASGSAQCFDVEGVDLVALGSVMLE